LAGDDSSDCVDNNNASGTDGNKAQMWACDGNTAAQNWTVNSNGTLTIDGGCMDITGAKYTDGTLIEWWTCSGGANQQWEAESGELVNPTSGMCLDDPGSNTTEGTQLTEPIKRGRSLSGRSRWAKCAFRPARVSLNAHLARRGGARGLAGSR